MGGNGKLMLTEPSWLAGLGNTLDGLGTTVEQFAESVDLRSGDVLGLVDLRRGDLLLPADLRLPKAVGKLSLLQPCFIGTRLLSIST